MTSVQIPQLGRRGAADALGLRHHERGLARRRLRAAPGTGSPTSTAAVPTSLVRVSERESGFFCDFEAMLERLVPRARQDRERMLLALLGPRTEQIPFDGRPALPRPVAAGAALLLRRRHPRRLHAHAPRLNAPARGKKPPNWALSSVDGTGAPPSAPSLGPRLRAARARRRARRPQPDPPRRPRQPRARRRATRTPTTTRSCSWS